MAQNTRLEDLLNEGMDTPQVSSLLVEHLRHVFLSSENLTAANRQSSEEGDPAKALMRAAAMTASEDIIQYLEQLAAQTFHPTGDYDHEPSSPEDQSADSRRPGARFRS